MIWNIDDSNSVVGFGVKHLMVSTVHGRFNKFSGKIDWNEDDLANSTVEASVVTSTVETGDKSRDKHLRAPDFFDIQNYHTMDFKSTRIKQVAPTKYRLTGNLTIKNVTKEITFEVDYIGRSGKAFSANSAPFKAVAMINRKDFGLSWSPTVETGGIMVADKIKIELTIKAVKESIKETADTVAA